jgi:Skp family chaperone for outer membrane proteins
MIKQKHLASTLELCFRQLVLVLFLSFFNIFQSTLAQEETKLDNIEKINFPAAVIDMKLVLAKSSAFITLQKEIQKYEKNYKEEIQNEENLLKKEQEKLLAQKSVLSAEEFKEKEDRFRQNVNKIQGKVEKIRRELESTMAKGMQVIQKEAVKHMKEIAKKEGYLLVFDANTTVISADRINISNIVVEKLNKSLPKITVEKKKEKKVD